MSFTDFLDAEKLIVAVALATVAATLCGVAFQIHRARNGWVDHFPAPEHPKRLDQRFRDGGAA